MPHKIHLASGEAVPVSEDHAQRLLYAMTTIALTPIGTLINVLSVTGPNDELLWKRPTPPTKDASDAT